MIRHFSPAENLPSISFFVPYCFVSLRRISIGLLSLIEYRVAIGSAVYGTPHTLSHSMPLSFTNCSSKLATSSWKIVHS